MQLLVYISLKNKYIYYKSGEVTKWGGHGATRAADSYFVSNKCAKKLNNYFKNKKNIDESIDAYLNYVIRELDLIVYWAEPTIVKQGSGNIFKHSYID